MGGGGKFAGQAAVARDQPICGRGRHRSGSDGTRTPRFARLPEDFDIMVQNGGAIAGSPGTIREQVRRMVEEAGANYFISQFSFGDLGQEEVLHSAGIFAREVLPAARERVAQVV
jgi:alkanesulfonate monooxygenase SsuD/methylene tetrahydromethanopterin reductase-like flavin-dependent oxidoreductase (luciferase family)